MKRVIAVLTLIACFPLAMVTAHAEKEVNDVVNINQMESSIVQYIEAISEVDTSYATCIGSETTMITPLYNDEVTEVSSYLFGLYSNNEYVGYVIVRADDCVVLESSTGDMPYNVNAKVSKSTKFVYDFGNYGVNLGNLNGTVYSQQNNCATVQNYFYTTNSESTSHNELAVAGTRSNLSASIYLQGSYNCIVCATSHLLLYWNEHGFPGLTPTITNQSEFNAFMDTIDDYFIQAGGYANNNIPSVIYSYASTRVPGFGLSGNRFFVFPQNTWYPEYADLTSEIAAGRPVLLGFALGSDYSQTEGHMTVCIGAQTSILEYQYVAVIDGHNRSIVTKMWDADYNDFICALQVGTM